MHFNSFARREMNGMHEPVRQIGANRQQRETKFFESIFDGRKMTAEACIAGEVNVSRRRLNHETAPECAVAITKTATREVFRRHTTHLHVGRDLDPFPPIEFSYTCDSTCVKQGAVSQAGQEA